jgi:hypothetical protein
MGGTGDRRTFDTMRRLTAGARVVGELALDGSVLRNEATRTRRVAAWAEQIRDRLSED